MELFPYILVREAGISKDLLAYLPSIEDTFKINEKQANAAYKEYQNNLLFYLNNLIRIDEKPCIRIHLMNIRRAVSYHQKIKQKDLNKITTHSFKEDLLNRISEFAELKLDIQKSTVDFNNAFEKAQLAEIIYLFEKKNELNLLNGLLFSSPDFYERLAQTQFDRKRINKKTRQTFLKLLEYFSRASHKTSPFSSFGKIGFYNLTKKQGLDPIQQSVIYTNSFTVSEKSSIVDINPTIFEDEEYFYFFVLGNNGETLNRIVKNEDSIHLYNLLNSINNNQSGIQSTLDKLDEEFTNYLFESGFLIKVTNNDNSEISNSLKAIQNTFQANITAKKLKIETLKSELRNNGNEKPLFYEDYFITPKNDIPERTFKKITHELNQLTKLLAPLHFSNMRETIKLYCLKNLENEEAINFVELVQEIKALPSTYLDPIIERKKKERQAFKNELEKICKDNKKEVEQGVVSFNFSDFDFAEKESQSNFFAAHLQIETINQQPKAIINSISNGAGKLFGRFAIQYSEVVKDLKNYIYNNENGYQLILNQDFSSSPVNAHPAIIDQKIAIPNKSEKGVSPGNLYVSYDTKTDQLNLTDVEGTPIKIINLGVESESTRNYFYPYLSAFTGTRCVISPLLEIINSIYQKNVNGKYVLPRIQIGNHLILQRKSWHFPIDQIPQKQKGVKDADYYLKIQEWIGIHHLPKRFFIRTNSKFFSNQPDRINNVQHKPQYIDFTKIGFVSLFNKRLTQVNDFLEITEPLPEINCFSNNNSNVKEYAIEWFG